MPNASKNTSVSHSMKIVIIILVLYLCILCLGLNMDGLCFKGMQSTCHEVGKYVFALFGCIALGAVLKLVSDYQHVINSINTSQFTRGIRGR
jgi:hypothetical protein